MLLCSISSGYVMWLCLDEKCMCVKFVDMVLGLLLLSIVVVCLMNVWNGSSVGVVSVLFM